MLPSAKYGFPSGPTRLFRGLWSVSGSIGDTSPGLSLTLNELKRDVHTILVIPDVESVENQTRSMLMK